MNPRILQLLAAARAWAAADCDASDRRAALEQAEHVEQSPDDDEAVARFERAFAALLSFGTAGMRGEVTAGPGGMNRAVVRLTTRAVADYLRAEAGDDQRTVVLGYDARLSSRALAEEAAGTLVAAGLQVRYFEAPTPTPVIAYAALYERAAAAIIITASHNPKQDNGYKLYGSDGIQIVSPVDERITELRAALSGAADIPCEQGVLDGASSLAVPIGAELVDDYFRAIAGLVPDFSSGTKAATDDAQAAVRVVYTPIHGVGGAFVERSLHAAGFRQLHVVAEQALPDGTFPTAPNPNPERPGVLDAAFAAARELAADVVLANDPDADRLAVGVPASDGSFVRLTGNQIGILLADSLLRVGAAERPLVVSSIVSTPMLASIAEKYGARAELTLTGFKWLWTAGLELCSQGYQFVLGFEEALGYSVGEVVRDKDGISAALVFAHLVAVWRSRGQSALSRLESLYREHGLWVSTQLAVKREPPRGTEEIQAAVARLAGAPPKVLLGAPVTAVVDYRGGAEARPRWLGQAPLVELRLGDRGRVLVRPSGTEPLLKIYVDLRQPLEASADVWQMQAKLVARADELAQEVKRAAGI